jgi:eukaryotic-like serine/threonine-protein kinase
MQATKPGFRLPLAFGIFAICAGLIIIVVAATLFITWSQGRKIADDNVRRSLDTSASVQDEFRLARLELLQTTIQNIAEDTSVKAYFESAVVDSELGLGDDPMLTGEVSLQDLLAERQQQYQFDLGIFMDASGSVVARTDETEAIEQNLSGDLFINASIERAKPISGYWRQQDVLYQAAIMPIIRDENLLGFLLLAREVNDEFASKVGKVSGADIAYVVVKNEAPMLFASSLGAQEREAFSAAVLQNSALKASVIAATAMEGVKLSFAGKSWLARIAPVDVDSGPNLGNTVILTSADRAYAGFQRILNLVLLTGLGSLLAALPISYLLAKGVLRPVKVLAKAAEEAASGNFRTHLSLSGNDELASLSRSFDRLLSELREKSDIEGYVSNLSRFLPEPSAQRAPGSSTPPAGSPVPTLRAPTLGMRVLLGIECRALARPMSKEQSIEAGQGLDAYARAVEIAAHRGGGQLLSFSGTRAIIGFSGDQAMLRALRSVRHLRRDSLLDDGLASSLAFSLHQGDIVEGQLALAGGSVPVAGGGAIYQLERLLAESVEAGLFIAKPMLESLQALHPFEVKPVTGLVSGRHFPGVTLDALDDLEPLPAVAEDTSSRYATVVTPVTAAAQTRRGGSDIALGTVFGGRYEILSELGAGGMGVVYKARDLELDDLVAIKMLRGAAMMDAEQLDRLKSELKLARKITHPNVLRTFDFGDHEGRPYISMEYVRGMTLRYLIKQAGRIPFSAGLRIAKQLCAGLNAAHEVGVLHRDIKPENLILEQSGNAKLMDFGIARPIRRMEPGHTQPGMFVGTPHYSAPEQLAGDEVDHRADIYSSGVLLSEMFCGKLPFTGANTMEIYMAQMQQSPIRPSEYWPEIPPELEQVILRCIARAPDERFQSVGELGVALAAIRV